ncbi:hypothetical protein J437_LFUL008383 [Ladona fulva]|uniref:Uncharacterized protein n=1 Tax=Ladona fulva TaxID=123851 RepID=A0A8K0K3N6_LADFU|nr:hypothetical protein J437_LFUL008383 [Ladona fulva]
MQNPQHTPTPRLMMFQKSMDELSPLSQAYSHISPPSSLSSGDRDEPPSQRRLNFSDSSNNGCKEPDDLTTKPKNNSQQIETSAKESETESTITSQDTKSESSLSHSSTEDCRQTRSKKIAKHVTGNTSCNKVSYYPSPFKQPFEPETDNWSQGPNVSPMPSTLVPNRQEKHLGQDLVTSTPASYSHRYPTRLRMRTSLETSLLYHHTSCMLTPGTSDENNSMSPITRSTQKMSKAMQETMMTPRSRKPVLALSGSNISHVPSLHLCGQIQADINASTCANGYQEEESSSESKDSTKKESVSLSSDSPFSDTNEKDKSISNENLSIVDDVKVDNGDSESLTSTFINYLQSRSVLTASPIDLSCDEGSRPGSPVVLELVSLKSEDQLSDSLLYCLDGNIPSPSASSSAQEMEKSTREPLKVSSEIPESQRKPRKRKSSEFQKEVLISSTEGSPLIKIMPHKNCDNLDSYELASEDTPKNKSVIETSL